MAAPSTASSAGGAGGKESTVKVICLGDSAVGKSKYAVIEEEEKRDIT